MWKAFWCGFWVIVKAVFSALGIIGAFAGGLWLLMIFFEALVAVIGEIFAIVIVCATLVIIGGTLLGIHQARTYRWAKKKYEEHKEEHHRLVTDYELAYKYNEVAERDKIKRQLEDLERELSAYERYMDNIIHCRNWR